jgi:hypothetical protein
VAEERVERFTVWGSRIIGGLGVALAIVVVVLGIPGIGDAYPPVAYASCGLVVVVLWVSLIRPTVAVVGERLLLRNPLSTVRVPLAAIEQVIVRQWLTVSAGDRRFTSSGIGRSSRQALRDDRRGDVSGVEIANLSYGAIVERRIDRLAGEARMQQGVERYSDEQQVLADAVRREWAWVEIVLLALFAVAVGVTAFL